MDVNALLSRLATPASRFEITGLDQHAAWKAREMPPVELVRPGIWSIPVPIPDHPVRYTLAYAFQADEGIILVDPGWEHPASEAHLRAAFAMMGAGFWDVIGIIVTHSHPDHFGLAGLVRHESDAWIGMSRNDAIGLHTYSIGSDDDDRALLLPWGVPEAYREELLWGPAERERARTMPELLRPLLDGARIAHGRWELEIVATPGHTSGHICVYVHGADLLLTGDHVLPRITSNVSDHTLHADPPALTQYLESLDQLLRYESAEILPAHEYRFRGIGARARALAGHHEERSAEIVALLGGMGPSTTWAIARRLTWSRGWDKLNGVSLRMALAETSAHLNYLCQQKRVEFAGDPLVYTAR